MPDSSMKPHQNYGIGLAPTGVSVIIDEDGNVFYFDTNQKKVNGTSKLPGTVVGPVNVSCAVEGPHEGAVAVDGAGNIWMGPARGGHDWQQVAKVP